MLRVGSVVEKNTLVLPPRVVTVPADTATLILEECDPREEYVARYIQNVGDNNAHYAWGVLKADGSADCDNVELFHGLLVAGQQLDCSAHAFSVCVYSVAGTTIATTVVVRNSLGARN